MQASKGTYASAKTVLVAFLNQAFKYLNGYSGAFPSTFAHFLVYQVFFFCSHWYINNNSAALVYIQSRVGIYLNFSFPSVAVYPIWLFHGPSEGFHHFIMITQPLLNVSVNRNCLVKLSQISSAMTYFKHFYIVMVFFINTTLPLQLLHTYPSLHLSLSGQFERQPFVLETAFA